MRELAEKLYADMKSVCRLDLQLYSLRKNVVQKPELRVHTARRIELLREQCANLDAEEKRLLQRHIQSVIQRIQADTSKKNWAEQMLTLESLAALIHDPQEAIVPATPSHFYQVLFYLEYHPAPDRKRAALHEQIQRMSIAYKQTAYQYVLKYWTSVPRVRRLLGLLDTRFEHAELPDVPQSQEHAA